jgi:hypothetical protein
MRFWPADIECGSIHWIGASSSRLSRHGGGVPIAARAQQYFLTAPMPTSVVAAPRITVAQTAAYSPVIIKAVLTFALFNV